MKTELILASLAVSAAILLVLPLQGLAQAQIFPQAINSSTTVANIRAQIEQFFRSHAATTTYNVNVVCPTGQLMHKTQIVPSKAPQPTNINVNCGGGGGTSSSTPVPGPKGDKGDPGPPATICIVTPQNQCLTTTTNTTTTTTMAHRAG